VFENGGCASYLNIFLG